MLGPVILPRLEAGTLGAFLPLGEVLPLRHSHCCSHLDSVMLSVWNMVSVSCLDFQPRAVQPFFI
jgi:hypothetical protein